MSDAADPDADADAAPADAAPAPDAATPTDATPGTIVTDRDTSPADPGVAVVTARLDAAARDVQIEALDTTVAGANPTYPPDSPVIEVAYARDLDHTVGADRWRAWPAADFTARLDRHLGDWSLSVRRYTFPAARLLPIGTTDAPGPDHTALKALARDALAADGGGD